MNRSAFVQINKYFPFSELDRAAITNEIKPFENEIRHLISVIKSKPNYSDIIDEFDILQEYHLTSAQLLWKYDFVLPDQLEKFVRDFDRIDNPKKENIYLMK